MPPQEGRHEDLLAGADGGAEDEGERGAHQDLRRAHCKSRISLNDGGDGKDCSVCLGWLDDKFKLCGT